MVITLTDFGAKPDSGEDTQPAMQGAIEAASRISEAVLIDCPRGCYHFYSNTAVRAPYYISNSASEEENPDVMKTIGILLKGMHHLTLDGNGSLFIFHGKQTMFLLDSCSHVEIRNVHTDFAQPTVVEMTILQSGSNYFEVKVHPDFNYELHDGVLDWVGEGWRFRHGPMQAHDPIRNTTRRIDNWFEQALRVEEISSMLLRLYFDFTPIVADGTILQSRDGIRDQAGVFIVGSSGVRFTNVGLHFMHGLGIVGQFSENITFQRMDLSPRIETGRTATGFADFIHMSGCRGKVRVEDSRLTGAHDDGINVHGTYLSIIGRLAENRLKVRFMHPQTYGFQPFYPGDEIDFVRSGSLTVYGNNRVFSVQWINPREVILNLVYPVPENLGEHDVIENVTWTPEVEIINNHFSRIPTRGILATTQRRVVISGNVFERLQMSAILIAADAESWYESGRVMDVNIIGNRFIECGSNKHPVLFISPENKTLDVNTPVHRNIRIENNSFVTLDAILLSAKSTSSLAFRNNEVEVVDNEAGPSCLEEAIRLIACSGVDIAGNSFTGGSAEGT